MQQEKHQTYMNGGDFHLFFIVADLSQYILNYVLTLDQIYS